MPILQYILSKDRKMLVYLQFLMVMVVCCIGDIGPDVALYAKKYFMKCLMSNISFMKKDY